MGYKNLIFSLFSKRKSSADKEEESAKSREPEEKKKYDRLKKLRICQQYFWEYVQQSEQLQQVHT